MQDANRAVAVISVTPFSEKEAMTTTAKTKIRRPLYLYPGTKYNVHVVKLSCEMESPFKKWLHIPVIEHRALVNI